VTVTCNECGRPGDAATAPGPGESIARFTPCDTVYLDGCSGVFEERPEPSRKRASWIRYPDMDRLDRWGGVLFRATGQVAYLVGSALERRDFGDVDVRIILDDEVYDALFPAPLYHPQRAQALWSMLCEAISAWGRQETGLPIDFQFQRRTQANEEEPGAGRRHALGLGKWAQREDGEWVLR